MREDTWFAVSKWLAGLQAKAEARLQAALANGDADWLEHDEEIDIIGRCQERKELTPALASYRREVLALERTVCV